MKKLLNLMLCLMLISPMTFAQTKKTTTSKTTTTARKTTTSAGKGKTTNKTTAKSKPTSKSTNTTNTKPAAKPAPPKVIRTFEGTLMCVSKEYHSKALLSFSYGMAYNGIRCQTITISGNKAHVYDENMMMHTIYNSDANVCYVYSDLTNTGVSYSLDDYRKTFSSYSDRPDSWRYEWSSRGDVQYKGDNLKAYHASMVPLMQGADMKGSIEVWSSNAFKVGDIIKDVLHGIDPHGLPKKWVCENISHVPIFGTFHSTVSTELVAINEASIDASAFEVPEDITIVPDKASSCKEIRKMYKAHRKEMKKQGITPNEYENDILPEIKQDWTFVQDVENDENTSFNITELMCEAGRSLITAAADYTKEEIEKRTQQRIEENILRQRREAQEAQMVYAPVQRTQHNTPATSSRPVRGKTNAQARSGNTPSTQKGKVNAKRAMEQVKQRRGGHFSMAAAMEAYDKKIMDKVMKDLHVEDTYVQPGTVFDSRIHIKCVSCNDQRGRCKMCNGMGFHKKIYDKMVTPDGVASNGTSDVPMKGTKRDCTVCDGHGECQSCKGSGKSPISVSGTDIKKPCTICRGSKKCKSCHGKGYYTVYRPDTSGECNIEDESTQAGRSTVEKETNCGQCDGTGKCTTCKGKKHYTNMGQEVYCNMCNDNGDCFVCHGTKVSKYTARE